MWLIPSTYSRSAPGSECLTSDSRPDLSTLESRAAQLPMRNGTPMQPRSLLRSWKQDAWMRRLCGAAIWDDSTGNRFVVESMPLSPVSPASRTRSPASAPEPTTNAGSGPQSPESFATLVRGLWCWRTSEDFFQAAEWVQYSQTFPTSGSMRNGRCWERERWAPRTGGSGSLSSAWPTARAEDSESCGNHPGATDGLTGATAEWYTPEALNQEGYQVVNGKRYPRLGAQAQTAMGENWLTPHGMSGMDHTGKAGAGGEFAAMVERWPTPTAVERVRDEETMQKCADFRKRNANQNTVPLYLGEVAQNWPTPCAQDDNKSPEAYRTMRREKLGRTGAAGETISSLQVLVQTWPTPDLQDTHHGSRGASPERIARRIAAGRQISMEERVAIWPTPQAFDSNDITRQTPPDLSRGGASEPVPGSSELVNATSAGREEREPEQVGLHDVGLGREQLADANVAGSQKRRGGGSDDGSFRPTSGTELAGIYPIFAPGPSDPRWPGIIRERPDLAPATQSSVRSLAHGMAGMVDESRRDQLRCIGNGVVPLQAAVAIVGLVRRLMQ